MRRRMRNAALATPGLLNKTTMLIFEVQFFRETFKLTLNLNWGVRHIWNANGPDAKD